MRDKKPPLFTAAPFSSVDKNIDINGPNDLRLSVDFDDVNHSAVKKQVKKLLTILNERWEDYD